MIILVYYLLLFQLIPFRMPVYNLHYAIPFYYWLVINNYCHCYYCYLVSTQVHGHKNGFGEMDNALLSPQ